MVPSSRSALPSWEVFKQDYVEPRTPVSLVVIREEHKRSVIFAEPARNRIGGEFAVNEDRPPISSPLSEILIDERNVDGRRYLQVSTSNEPLFKSFYLFLSEVVDLVADQDIEPIVALTQTLDRWNALLRSIALLSEEEQLGLLGELWVLDRLVTSQSERALQSWLAPSSEVHDFRFSDIEIEVKVTRKTRREHIISSIGQLQPSADRRLFLVSIQMVPAGPGAGITLPEYVETIRSRLASWSHSAERFMGILRTAYRYNNEDQRHYERRWQFRTRPALIPVIDGFPRLVPAALQQLPDTFAPSRISVLSYSVDVEALGFQEGSAEFSIILPSA